MTSPEMNLILALTGDIYKQPEVPFPDKINWEKFRRLASLNKVLYYTTAKVVENKPLSLKLQIPQSLIASEIIMKNKRVKLCRTLKVANNVLEHEPHLLLKTYRGYPFISHDVDFLVKDLEKARRLFEKSGFTVHLLWDRRSFYIVKEGLLEIEVYDKISPGSLILVDEKLPWYGYREALVEGVKTRLLSVEADILTYLTDTNFRTYEMSLGDVLYIYKLSTEADWGMIAEQANKYGWLIPFNNTVAVLNSLHLKLFKKHSPIEQHFKFKANVSLDLPYIPPLSQVVKALMEKGVLNFVKLPGYYSVRLKKRHEGLWRAYSEVILSTLSDLSFRYWNH